MSNNETPRVILEMADDGSIAQAHTNVPGLQVTSVHYDVDGLDAEKISTFAFKDETITAQITAVPLVEERDLDWEAAVLAELAK